MYIIHNLWLKRNIDFDILYSEIHRIDLRIHAAKISGDGPEEGR